MNKSKLYTFLIWLLILGGIFLRFHNLRFNTVFDWDQENSVAYPAKEIVINKHFPLIGPRTGIGDLRLAPLYNYISAGFFALNSMRPITAAYESAVLSLMTIVVSYILIRKLFDRETALYYTLIYSISPLIISLDRIPWNVNLFPLASILIFSGLWVLLKSKKLFGWLMSGAGIIIGFSSHYTILFWLTAAILFVIFNRRLISREIGIFALASLLAILPLIIFNFRHDLILTKNIIQTSSYLIRPELLFSRFINVSSSESEFIGRVLIADGAVWIQQALALIFIISLVLMRKKVTISRFNKIYFSVVAIYLIGFTIYSRDIPEYYFSGLIPLVVFGFSSLISQLLKMSDKLKLFIAVFSAILFVHSFSLVNQVNPQSLGAKENIIRKIREHSGTSPVKIIYDMDLGWSYGYKYLLDFYSVTTDDQEKDNIFWISYPQKRFPLIADFVADEIALGYPNTSKKIYDTKQIEFYDNLFKLRVLKNWVSLQCSGIDFDRYLLTDDLSASCNTLDNRTDGILIENVPDCNIWETTGLKQLKTAARIPVYSIPADNVKAFAGRNLKDVPVISFERNRCVGFIDLSTVSSTESAKLKELFLTIEK